MIAQGSKDLSDDRVICDWLKYNIRAHAKEHSKRGAKERNEKENRFEEEYAKAKQGFEADPNNINLNILNAAKESLETVFDEKLINGVIIYVRARWNEHGDRSSKYFHIYNLEKRHRMKKQHQETKT